MQSIIIECISKGWGKDIPVTRHNRGFVHAPIKHTTFRCSIFLISLSNKKHLLASDLHMKSIFNTRRKKYNVDLISS